MIKTPEAATRPEDEAIRFEIQDRMRRVSYAVSNEALEAAAGLPELSSPMLRRRSFDRFRTLIHRAAGLRLAVLPPGFDGPIVLTSRDLRAVPPEKDMPVFGRSAGVPARPAVHPHPRAAPRVTTCKPAP
jgi:hypothetical protein